MYKLKAILSVFCVCVLLMACSDDDDGTTDAAADTTDDVLGGDVAWDVSADGSITDTVADQSITLTGTLNLEGTIDATDIGGFALALLPADYELGGDPTSDMLAGVGIDASTGYTGGDFSVPSSTVLLTFDYDQTTHEITVGPDAYAGSVGSYSLVVAFFPDFTDGFDTHEDPTHLTMETLVEIEITSLPATVNIGTVTIPEAQFETEVALTGDLSLSDTIDPVTEGGGFIIFLLPDGYVLMGNPSDDVIGAVISEVEAGYTGGTHTLEAEDGILAEWDEGSGGDPMGDPWEGEAGEYSLFIGFMPTFDESNDGPTHMALVPATPMDDPFVIESLGVTDFGSIELEPFGPPE